MVTSRSVPLDVETVTKGLGRWRMGCCAPRDMREPAQKVRLDARANE
jgi:hypothetical protein